MGRAPCCDKANVKKGPWSPDEDAKLKSFIEQNGTGGNWITLPSKAGLKRCGKSCRLRWINYLRPDIKHGSFTEEEEILIYKLHASIGSRWSLIAAQLPGRTDNDIKNYWNTRLKKKLAEKKGEQSPRPFPTSPETSEKVDEELVHLPCQPVTDTSDNDGLLQHILKPHQFDHTSPVECSQVTADDLTGMMMPPGVDVKPDVTQAVPQAHVDQRLMMIESSLLSCISSHTSPTSSCSGISTDRSSHAAPAQCADSPYTESLNYGEGQSLNYVEGHGLNYGEGQSCIQDGDTSLLTVNSGSPASLIVPHSMAMSDVMHPEILDKFRIDDDSPFEDVMQSVVLSDGILNRSYSNGVKEEYAYDANLWAAALTSPKPPRIPRNMFPLRNMDAYLPPPLSLDPLFAKSTFSWMNNNTCFGTSMGMGSGITDFGQMRFGNPVGVGWDNYGWQLSESR